MDVRILNLRAIAILIVVQGHSIILYDPAWGLYHSAISMPLFEGIKQHLINPIQMPIFFFISGFLFYFSVNGKRGFSFMKFFRSKFTRLIIPYFCIAFLWMDPIKWFVDAPGFEHISNFKSIILYQTLFSGYLGHLWYLPTLFGVFVISYLSVHFLCNLFKTLNREYIHAIIFVVSLILHYFSSYLPSLFCLSSIANNLVYFYGGVAFNVLINSRLFIPPPKVRRLLWLCLIASLGCAIYFVEARVFFVLLFVPLSYLLLPQKTNRFIRSLSDNSYGIYLFHSPLIYITYTYLADASPWLVIFLNFIVMGGISYLLTILIEESRIKFIVGN